MLDKYKGHSAQVCSYGLYRVDNLVNDLAKVCGLPYDKTVEPSEAKANKQIISDIKKYIKEYIDEGFLQDEELERVSGIEGLRFCHTGRFIVNCKDYIAMTKVLEEVCK